MIETIIIVGFVVFMAAMIMWMVHGFKKPKLPKFDRAARRITLKEKKLLNNIIKDMKENSGHWVNNGYCPITFKGPSIVNDYSCIGIQFSLMGDGTPSTVMIHFNLNNLTKFEQENDDSIATVINGSHAQKFINTVTSILDERGKELDYISLRIEERL